MATGTVTQLPSKSLGGSRLDRDVDSYLFTWLSTAGGAASDVTSKRINGIIEVEFIPDSGGTQPTNLYDVTLTDEYGVDVLAGQGADLSNATATIVCPGVALKDGTTTSVVPRFLNNLLTLNVTNAGNAKGGKVVLYFR